MSEYRVNLDVYNGPLDLLLYLIRRDEVDIRDIPISHITGQYVKYVDLLSAVDPNLAGEFLVMAASLMELKTRMLLPSEVVEEGGDPAASAGFDPRTELVRQLLEYKAFKDAAADLQAAATRQALKFPRKPFVPKDEQGEFDLEDVQVWDLLDAFSKLMASVGQLKANHEVIYDDTPVELHAEDIMDRLMRDGAMSFARIFEGRQARGEIVGLFLALLELVRQKRVFAMQDANFGEIAIHPNPNPPAQESADHVAHFSDETEAPAGSQGQAGLYVSDESGEASEITAGAGEEGAEETGAGEGGSAVALEEEDQPEDQEDEEDEDDDDEDDDEEDDEDLDDDEDEDDEEDIDDEDEDDLDEDDDSDEEDDEDEDEDDLDEEKQEDEPGKKK